MVSLSQRLSSLVAVAAGVFVFASNAQAQCPSPTSGPDVICGDIQGTANYNLAGGLDALALGTVSCNIGNVNLNWISGTVNHPLMGGELFKYKVVNGSGRFESLGQSWLKHAFTALTQNLCCTCNGMGGSVLGQGCSDPYTASRNGGQSMLGPKFQANAHTGAYLASHPTPSTTNGGRIEMLVTDLEPSSASVLYFGEMMYVALDDAKANNSDNNVSYRALSCITGTSTAGFDFGLLPASSTQRSKPGLEAWKGIDPAVTLTYLSVPEGTTAPYDGNARVVLGSRVTNLGGGQWHYEYALYNQNSDRSIASFTVPIPVSAVVTNIGFRDVAYLAGDGNGSVNFDGTDWPSSRVGTTLTWSTTPFATNANSNALRWGTTYNFRFDANVGPVAGTIVLGQYKVVNNVNAAGVEVPGIPPAFEAFCSNGSLGTDHTTACPCANAGLPGNGCGHSFDAGGANLSATGAAALDNVVLTSQFEPSTSFTLFMQHDAAGDGVFHDGVLCAGGSLIRLRGRAAAGGSALFPDSTFANDATLTLSQRGSVTVGSGARRYYAAWYRNASTTFCPPATANVSNGFRIDW